MKVLTYISTYRLWVNNAVYQKFKEQYHPPFISIQAILYLKDHKWLTSKHNYLLVVWTSCVLHKQVTLNVQCFLSSLNKIYLSGSQCYHSAYQKLVHKAGTEPGYLSQCMLHMLTLIKPNTQSPTTTSKFFWVNKLKNLKKESIHNSWIFILIWKMTVILNFTAFFWKWNQYFISLSFQISWKFVK